MVRHNSGLIKAVLIGLIFMALFVMARGLLGPPSAKLQEAYEENPESPVFDHSIFDVLLKQHVDSDGWVDYVALQKESGELDRYIESLAKAPLRLSSTESPGA